MQKSQGGPTSHSIRPDWDARATRSRSRVCQEGPPFGNDFMKPNHMFFFVEGLLCFLFLLKRGEASHNNGDKVLSELFLSLCFLDRYTLFSGWTVLVVRVWIALGSVIFTTALLDVGDEHIRQ